MIRAVEPEDLDLMYLIENDCSLWVYGAQTVHVSVYQLKRYIEDSSADIYRDGQVRFTITDENSAACGFVDLTDFDAKNMRAEVGIVLMPEAQGRGLASKALKEVKRYAKGLGMVQLWAVVAEGNLAAVRLFRSCGFSETAVLKDWIMADGKPINAKLYQFIILNS